MEFLNRMQEYIDVRELVTQTIEFLPSLFAGLLVLLAAYVFFRVTRTLIVKALRRTDFEDALINLLVNNIYRYAILIIGFIMAADQMGIDITTALAGVGVIGIAVGFAAQDAVGNVIAGILIFWDKPFKVGDWIETEGEYGRVTNITLRTTRIRTPRNTYVVIPNKRIIDEVMENYTKHGELRVDVPVGIAYGEDIGAARKALLAAVGDMDGVLSDPEPDVIVDELADSSVNLKVRVWIKDANGYKRTYYAALERCKTALDEAEIEIPFPHLQLIVDEIAEQVWQGAGDVMPKVKSA